jgi:hypothetical protein
MTARHRRHVLEEVAAETEDLWSPTAAEELRLKYLWDDAYIVLQKKDDKLIDAYEKGFLESQDPHPQGTSGMIRFHVRVQKIQMLSRCLPDTSKLQPSIAFNSPWL